MEAKNHSQVLQLSINRASNCLRGALREIVPQKYVLRL